MGRVSRTALAGLVALGGFAACSDSSETGADATRAPRRVVGYVKRVDRQRHIVDVDVARLLTGAAAQAAYEREFGTGATLDSDFWISNPDTGTTRIPLGDDVDIRVNNLGGFPPAEPAQSTKVSFDTFLGYFQGDKHDQAVATLFSIRLDEKGRASDVEEQYLP